MLPTSRKRRYPSSVISVTANPGRSIPQATTRRGLPLPLRRIRFPSTSRLQPGIALSRTSVATFSQPGGASSVSQLASALSSADVCCAKVMFAEQRRRTTMAAIDTLRRRLDLIMVGSSVRLEMFRARQSSMGLAREAKRKQVSPTREVFSV